MTSAPRPNGAPRRFLLVSDLDDTFLGDRVALQRFSEAFPEMSSRITLVYASGRLFDSIAGDIESTPLPEPAAVICGVGSEVRKYPSGELDPAWVDRISRNWSAQAVRDLLADETRLEPQPKRFQADFKVSYFFHDALQAEIDRIQAKLFDAGIDASLIYSSQRDLDVLPEGVNKGTAAAFLARELGFTPDQVIVAGDSGNDAALFQHDFYGIIVDNAHDELKEYASDPKVYLSKQERTAGVHDGLRHWLRILGNDE